MVVFSFAFAVLCVVIVTMVETIYYRNTYLIKFSCKLRLVVSCSLLLSSSLLRTRLYKIIKVYAKVFYNRKTFDRHALSNIIAVYYGVTP
uniref:Putative secreted protein n=1 Tax=Ixodes ricinus TaxID=34613 RepID=A0A147BT95_IXORI